MTMERDDIERITRMEEQLNQLSEMMKKILLLLETFNSHPYECEKKFLKKEEFEDEFDKSMIRYQEKSLQRKNNLLNFVNNAYKLIVTIAVIVMAYNQYIQK